MELPFGAGVAEATPEIKSRGEAALLIGIMSLVHVLLCVDLKQAIGRLMLPGCIEQAPMDIRVTWGAYSVLQSAWRAASAQGARKSQRK